MTIDDIRVLVAADESWTLELKKSTGDDALKEALINALCYRWWEQHNFTNSIAIYDDRIEIGNPGVFPPEITPETIKNPHDSYPYNPKIAEALYRTTWLEWEGHPKTGHWVIPDIKQQDNGKE